jgi:ABC-type branched-subunit amino acid transport system ATPase component
MSRLVAQHLAKSYGRRTIVRDLSLEVGAGEVVGLLGPNGAGKTTAFYMIVGLVPADAGRILIDDTDLTHRPIHARAQAGIGYLPQEASVFRKLSVEDNVLAILETRPGLDGAARAAMRSSPTCASTMCAPRQAWRCRAANAAASRSRARSPPTRASCCSTSRSPASTRSRCSTSSASSASSRRAASAC